ncbi:RING finger protein 122 [Anabarilius grahami]|uniref:RING finger protein 122 n=1 Tax=Anabarilius grahami TaxID=495550 RepID=A0A3N0YUI1_ANAGA|nr:RING finger protein 122 [Anabarilius grahami]
MTTDITGRLPLNVYVIILGIGLFIFMLSMIFCCYLFRCLVKWLEIRSVCPMCNKPICRLQPDPLQGAEGPQNPLEV